MTPTSNLSKHYRAVVGATQYAKGAGAVVVQAVYHEKNNMVYITLVSKDGTVQRKKLDLEDYKLKPTTCEYFNI